MKVKKIIQNDSFVLKLPAGSVIHLKDGTQIPLNEIPKDAQELWESGYYGFALKKGCEPLFEHYTKARLQKLIDIRKPLGYDDEMKILNTLLKNVDKPAKEKTTTEKPV